MEQIEEIISLIVSPDLQRELLPVKVVLIFFSIVFFVFIIYFFARSTYLKYQFVLDVREFFSIESASLRKFSRRWKRIQQRIGTGVEAEYKLAIIEAEDLLNDLLEGKGIKGENFEERINQIEKTQLPNLDEVLEAHKTRNDIMHDPNYKMESERAKKVLDIYEKAIKGIESF